MIFFGGWDYVKVDIVGAAAACQSLPKVEFLLLLVNNFVFKEPIFIGDLVFFMQKINKIGNTSITVG